MVDGKDTVGVKDADRNVESGNAEPQLGPYHRQPSASRLGPEEKSAELGLGAPGASAPGWRSRGYVPHLDDITKAQSITFRLADSLPQEKLRRLEQELDLLPEEKRNLERRRWIERWLDAGMGCCALRHPAVAAVMQETLLHFDGERYRLIAWCIMPNHVHVLIEPKVPLGGIVQSWKSYTGRWAMQRNAELGLGVPGKVFWMREYWDRFIRNEKHLRQAIDYIHENPVKAGLCADATEWSWSSAGI